MVPARKTVSWPRSWLCAAACALALAACSDLKEGGGDTLPDGGPTATGEGGVPIAPTAPPSGSGAPDDAATRPVGAGPTGPGPFGALPNGYCCADASECRSRQCVDGPGGRMCLDRCGDPSGCLATAGTFTCPSVGGGADRLCAPSAATRCTPGNVYSRGTRKLGDCCTATHDANAGLECEGGMCSSFGKAGNRYICHQACSKPSDCPGNYMCALGPYDFKICVPESGESPTCREP
ncbi:MAG: hypothetical protein IPQ09_04625 [Myxococcales bacterium]|nr:hypothetical protein [Myxococcales bacterium]HQY65320.1 hypothetical protein [Polyangiaceae bacterium]